MFATAIQSTAPATEQAIDMPLAEVVDIASLRRAIDLALRLGEHAPATQTAALLRDYFPEAIGPLVLLGQARLESGDPRAAIDLFRQALRLHPLDALAWAGLAGALAASGEREPAAAALRCAALHDPLGSEGLAPGLVDADVIGQGVIYLRRGHVELAAAELAAAIGRNPDRADMQLYAIEALRRSGDHAAASDLLESLPAAHAESFPALLVRAALAPPDVATALHIRLAHHDPDGQATRRFFAPEPPPWLLPPVPHITYTPALLPIAPFIAMLDLTSMIGAPTSPTALAQKSAAPAAPPPALAPPDPEIAAYIATTEKLRHTLADAGAGVRPLVPWSTGRTIGQLVLSSRSALVSRFGERGFAAIDERLRLLVATLGKRGVGAHLCYADDPATLKIGAARLPAAAIQPTAMRDLVRAAASAFAGQGRELGILMIVGGDAIVPFHRLANPIPDDDQQILSDNPYACDDAAHLIPHRIVARIPEGDGRDPALLLTLLDQMIEQHSATRRRGALLLPGRRSARRAFTAAELAGYCAEVWREPSRAVLDALLPGGELVSCPPLAAETGAQLALARRRLLYSNLHGASGLPNFYGQPEGVWGAASKLPIALRPDQLAVGDLRGGLLLSEACYGADLAGRTAANSILLRALACGALACVGATVNAYGSTDLPLVGADLLFHKMMAHLSRGAPVGEALHNARIEFAQEMYRRQGYLDDVDTKTLIEFVLLGDPWAGLGEGEAQGAVAAHRIPAIERLPKPRAKAVVAEADLPRDIVGRARDALRRLLPGVGVAPLHIVAQANPRRQRKGEPMADLVFSMHQSRSTEDGYQIEQTAHLTMSGRTVTKTALTR